MIKPRILVHLHLYYQKQLDYFLSKLNNISNCEWDLYVTVVKEDETVWKKIIEFKPDAKIIKIDNIGYDVWPFIQVIRMVNLDSYDYVIKLHTKNYRNKLKLFDYEVSGYKWRNSLVDSILKDKNYFKKILKYFSNDKKLGSITKSLFYWKIYHNNWPEESYKLNYELKRINFKSRYSYFHGGTMFIMRADVFKFLKAIEYYPQMFDCAMETGSGGSLAHVYERIFTIALDEAGYSVKTVDDLGEMFFLKLERFIRCFFRAIFSIQNKGLHKVFCILGFKIKTRRCNI